MTNTPKLGPENWIALIIAIFLLIQYIRYRSLKSNIKKNYDTIIKAGVFPKGTESSGSDSKTGEHFGVYIPNGLRFPFPISGVIIWKDNGQIKED